MKLQGSFLCNNILIILLLSLYSMAETVCKVSYTGQPENLHEQTITLPHGTVAMSEEITVDIPQELMDGSVEAGVSIFFVIDNSGSMFYDGYEMDTPANRFKVTSTLIDSIAKKNPAAEVGVSIFGSDLYFRMSHDTIFTALPGKSTYGYIPLLKLNESYSSDRMQEEYSQDVSTGKDILQEYLRTVNNPQVDENPLIYKGNSNYSTNITAGFDAAVNAFSNAQYQDRNKHYVIFISDGEAMAPENSEERRRFMQGVDVPTTFTIFFSNDNITDENTNGVPDQIDTMTTSIVGNGYSDNQYQTWAKSFNNTDSTALLNFVMENVINVISQDIEKDVKSISVNANAEHGIWKDKKIYFNEMFKLEGDTTGFTYDINYYVKKDFVVDGADTSLVVNETYTTNFTVALKDGVALPDSFSSTCWNRSISFIDNNQELSVIEVNNQAVLQFREDAGDDGYWYNYNNVQVELVSLVKQDTLNLALNKSSNIHTHGLDIRYDQDKDVNDGRLQVDMTDTIVAIFRNPKLPLDTLRDTIPYDVGTILSLKSGTYYDNNADGYIDSIFVTFGRDSELTKGEMTELLSLIQFPTERSFIIDYNGVAWVNGGMAIPVTENSVDPRTAVFDFDTLKLNESTLSNGGLTYNSTVKFVDSVAPIIVKEGVSLDDKPGSSDDKLIVTFSEEIKNEGKTGNYFAFRNNGKEYSAALIPDAVSGNTVTFSVGSIQGVEFIADGDSLQIHTTSNMVKDLSDITQNNDKNPWRKITVRSTISVSDATFYDANADGRVDSVTILVDAGEGANLNANDLRTKVVLPKDRGMITDTAWFEGNTLVMKVQELAGELNTAMGTGDTVVVLAGQSGSTVINSNITLSAIDSVAPVIKSDVLLRDIPGNGVDTLTVEFSEEIKENGTGRYFNFWNSTAGYSVDLQFHAANGSSVTFLVNSISGTDAIRTGDSLRISGDFSLVSDNGNVVQNNDKNIGRTIQVITTVSVSNAAYFDKSGDGFIDLITVNVDAGDGVTLEALSLAGQISLPSMRALTLDSANLTDKKLSMYVKEGSSRPNTAVSADDKIVLRAGRVGGAEISEDITVAVADSMAPVILDSSAILFDYPGSANDTLQVVFSEPVTERVQNGKYFNFRSGSNTYDVFLQPTSTEGATVRYKVELTAQVMKNGDMLKINSAQPMIMDLQTTPNAQRNENNTEVPLQIIAAIEVGEAAYYDENADGFIDLVTIHVAAGEGVTLTGNDLMTLIHLPAYRRFIPGTATVEDNLLKIPVVEDRTTPNTAVTNSDSITIEKGSIQGAIIPEARTIGVFDRVAPVILEDGAVIMDYADGTPDSMVVRFSETVAPMSIGGLQFNIRRGSEEYHLFLTPVRQSEEEVLYTVDNVIPFPYAKTGDSLRIDANLGYVRDSLKNVQKNATNIERRLQVFADINATDATYFDRDADGMIDSIRIGLVAGNSLYENESDFLAAAIELPEERLFEIDSTTYEGTSLVLFVTEGTEYPVTNIQSYDEIVVNDLNSAIGIIDMAMTLPVADSVAPVIVPDGAVLHDSLSGTDLLTVTLSEPIQLTQVEGEIFNFVDGVSPYQMVVKKLSMDSITVHCEIVSSTREEFMLGSDSIWINELLHSIVDANELVQTNSGNVKRAIQVMTYINPYKLEVKAITPYVQGITVVPEELNDPFFDLGKTTGGNPTGLIVQAIALLEGENVALQGMELEGSVTIVDVVGNVVANAKEMIFIPEYESIFFVWNCRNEDGREVGNGTYMASVSVRASTADGSYSKEYREILPLGLKRPLY